VKWRNDVLAFDMLVHTRMQDLINEEKQREWWKGSGYSPAHLVNEPHNISIRWRAFRRNEAYALYL